MMFIVIAVSLIAIGVIFFAKSLGVIDEETMSVLWPLLLVVLGLGILGCNTMGHKCKGKDCWTCEEVSFGTKKKKKK